MTSAPWRTVADHVELELSGPPEELLPEIIEGSLLSALFSIHGEDTEVEVPEDFDEEDFDDLRDMITVVVRKALKAIRNDLINREDLKASYEALAKRFAEEQV